MAKKNYSDNNNLVSFRLSEQAQIILSDESVLNGLSVGQYAQKVLYQHLGIDIQDILTKPDFQEMIDKSIEDKVIPMIVNLNERLTILSDKVDSLSTHTKPRRTRTAKEVIHNNQDES